MGRAPCCDKNGLKKGPWTPEEDQKLTDYIQKNGYGNWRTLPKNAGLQRCGKSCRLRWTNYLRPDIKRGRFSLEEEETIIQLHSILGNKWSAIAGRLPGRTDNEIKNYWNTHIRKRLLRMGIDPVTHSPRLELLDLSTILTSSLYSHPPSHLNFSRLLGMQPLLNPDLLRTLASSLLSSPPPNHTHFPAHYQDTTAQLSPSAATASLANHHHHQDDQPPQLMQYDAAAFNHWDASLFSAAPLPTYGYYASDPAAPALSSETSTFQSNSSSNNFSFQSVVSSPAPLHSASNYNNIHGGSTEDERESYCSTDYILDVADFI